MGHVGLTPQSVHAMGGFKVQGKSEEAAERVIEGARALDEAGVYAIVLEAIPPDIAEAITRLVSVPTIGIGAGPSCDGQVLVCYDLLGMNPDFKPKFVKRYGNLHGSITESAGAYFSEVRAGTFPDEEHSFKSSKNIRLVTTNPAPVNPGAEPPAEGAEKVGPIYGVPV
jgi:3-methyl-2-oxobutanoate hydroxymethyltransferase